MKRGTTGFLPFAGGRNAPAHQSHRSKIGTATEKMVETHNALCERAGLCALRRVPTPMRVTGSSPRGITAVYTASSTVDYIGWTLASPSRPVLVEVKHADPTETKAGGSVRFSFANLKPQQRIDLASVHKHGGIAILLVVSNARLYPVPWGVAQALLDAGRASIVVDEFLVKDALYVKALVAPATVISPGP